MKKPMSRYALAPIALAICLLGVSFGQAELYKRITTIINSYPTLSPDGKHIAFQSNRTGSFEIYLMDPDGKNVLQLTHSPVGVECATPSWSPDSRRIVYGRSVAGHDEVWLMDADGGNQHGIATGGDDEHPHWAANGRIIFNSSRTTPDPSVEWSKRWHEIFSMNPDGSDVRQYTHFRTVTTYASLSPDGRKFAFRRVVDGPAFEWDLKPTQRNSEVFVMDVDGSNVQNLSSSAAFDGWPFWSPDSKRVAFASNRLGPANNSEIFIVNADGSGLHQLTQGPGSYAQPSWAPDGKAILAYQNIEHGDQEWGDIVWIPVPEQK